MSNLLQVVRFKTQAVKDGKVPIIMEFKVNPESAPYLVSSSTGLMWIPEVHPGGIIKAAVRRDATPGDLFYSVLKEVVLRGVQDQWGNTLPFTEDGVRKAIEYVKSYDLEDLEILIPRIRSEGVKAGPVSRPEWLNPNNFKIPMRPSTWIPDKCVVVVPREREFVGVLGHLDAKSVVVCVHNPSRGMAFACDEIPPPAVPLPKAPKPKPVKPKKSKKRR